MAKVTVLALLCVVVAGPLYAQDKTTIQGQNDKLAAVFNKADAAGVRAMYTDDAAVLPAGGEIVRGKDLLPFWQAVVARIGQFKRTTLDVKPLGPNYAREIGTFSFTTKRELRVIDGKYVVVWRNVDGEWKLDADVWNTDQ
jgi:ketosteroid isomerase-like protein